ncbi:MAG: hypothetical protein AAF481_17155 [Acidobacteriota bacterium]
MKRCLFLALAVWFLLLAGPVGADSELQCEGVPYQMTPGAAEDFVNSPTNMLTCTAGKYALCYYSGADPLPCTADGDHADCLCQVYEASEAQPMYVEIGGILNECIYDETVEQCGEDGSKCQNFCTGAPDSPPCKNLDLPSDPPTATVCEYIRRNLFNPGYEFISTFSFAKVMDPNSNEKFKLRCTEDKGRYAGCMTAPCDELQKGENGETYVECACPLWPDEGEADYQYGRGCNDTPTGNCDLASNQVWSAAYNPAGCP